VLPARRIGTVPLHRWKRHFIGYTGIVGGEHRRKKRLPTTQWAKASESGADAKTSANARSMNLDMESSIRPKRESAVGVAAKPHCITRRAEDLGPGRSNADRRSADANRRPATRCPPSRCEDDGTRIAAGSPSSNGRPCRIHNGCRRDGQARRSARAHRLASHSGRARSPARFGRPGHQQRQGRRGEIAGRAHRPRQRQPRAAKAAICSKGNHPAQSPWQWSVRSWHSTFKRMIARGCGLFHRLA
jgi:hypothetical protein